MTALFIFKEEEELRSIDRKILEDAVLTEVAAMRMGVCSTGFVEAELLT